MGNEWSRGGNLWCSYQNSPSSIWQCRSSLSDGSISSHSGELKQEKVFRFFDKITVEQNKAAAIQKELVIVQVKMVLGSIQVHNLLVGLFDPQTPNDTHLNLQKIALDESIC